MKFYNHIIYNPIGAKHPGSLALTAWSFVRVTKVNQNVRYSGHTKKNREDE